MASLLSASLNSHEPQEAKNDPLSQAHSESSTVVSVDELKSKINCKRDIYELLLNDCKPTPNSQVSSSYLQSATATSTSSAQ